MYKIHSIGEVHSSTIAENGEPWGHNVDIRCTFFNGFQMQIEINKLLIDRKSGCIWPSVQEKKEKVQFNSEVKLELKSIELTGLVDRHSTIVIFLIPKFYQNILFVVSFFVNNILKPPNLELNWRKKNKLLNIQVEWDLCWA